MHVSSTTSFAPIVFTTDVRQAAKSAVGAADIAKSDTIVQPLKATSELESAQALLDATCPAPDGETTILTAQRGFFSTALLPDAPLTPTSAATDLLSEISALYLLA